MKTHWILFAVLVALTTVVLADDDDGCQQETNCKSDNGCVCASSVSPLKMSKPMLPQFVMLTFDDAVNAVNFEFYQELLLNDTAPIRDASKERITATFFASHEYNDYFMINELYRHGNEIATHSISHTSSTEAWKTSNISTWKEEIVGMREMLNKYAGIPEKEIVGFRAPFLQTSGDVTYQMLKNQGFLYDSSLPLQEEESPIYPFTFDFGFPYHCMIEPCPEKPVPGLWVVPMNSMYKERDMGAGSILNLPCAMADGCLPYPETDKDTYDYLMANFNRFYDSSRAPFPVFLHESWLKNAGRRAGYLRFVKDISKKQHVFIRTIKEVVTYMKSPDVAPRYNATAYRLINGHENTMPCRAKPNFCNYPTTPLSGPRIMYTCTSTCPKRYPWLGNTSGK